eukprot:TRINITY_DN17400_c0_g1_i1.p1 TRINITY_DN17400_c0_g1~~TRINITY_DN17400_c0_g1_i1.p1  ORF type:complete len:156 (-),score=31.71 TRINITY_DN17400_c0_g1_i1:143-610(-)
MATASPGEAEERTVALEQTAHDLTIRYNALSAALEQLQLPPSNPPSPVPTCAANQIRMVVQRCNKASILLTQHPKDQVWGHIERGLVVSLSFAKGADSQAVKRAVKALCSAPLVTFGSWGDGDKLWSMSDLVADGKRPQVMIVPQASLYLSLIHI